MTTTPLIRPITSSDLSEISVLQAKVWQDYFLSERGLQVPLLRRTEKNLMYYLGKEPDGCLLAEVDGTIIGCIFSHVWGSVGWFGPLEVATQFQNRGVGKELVTMSVQYLRSRGCKTIGLETMSNSHKNITMYAKLGFMPRHLSFVIFKKIHEPNVVCGEIRSAKSTANRADFKPVWDRIVRGLDYTTEFQAADEHKLGEVFIHGSEGNDSHAIVHTYEMFGNSPNAIVKLLVADSEESASELLDMCENAAIDEGKSGMFLRTYAAAHPRLGFFLDRGYALQSTSTRMILEGPDEVAGRFHVSCWSG